MNEAESANLKLIVFFSLSPKFKDMNREDLYLDEALLRRMKRDAEQGKEASSDDEEEHREVVDDSMEI